MNNQEKISTIVCESLTIDKVGKDEDLIESGLLDSLALVQLMVALEESFNITIAPEELDIEDYRSVNSMAKMVTRLSLISALSNYE